MRSFISLFALTAAAAGVAWAQPAANQPAPAGQPGTAASTIDQNILLAQVLLSANGFSPGVIDGKSGQSMKLALRSFQEARGLDQTGRIDSATLAALGEGKREATVMVKLTPDDVRHQYVYPFPNNPERQAELGFLGYRNMLEKVAERYHTTPKTIVALNGPEKLIGVGQTLRLPNVVPASRDYEGVPGNGANVMRILNVDGDQAKGDYVVVDKSEGSLKVYRGSTGEGAKGELIASFPVTTGSKQYPLPIGRWKATTYAFLPPFKYQPEILNNPKTDKELDLPPGPNGPVGVAWLDLTKEHYGIHGTNEPQTIGRAESSGCIRMTNWDVMRLARMMKPGFTAIFQA